MHYNATLCGNVHINAIECIECIMQRNAITRKMHRMHMQRLPHFRGGYARANPRSGIAARLRALRSYSQPLSLRLRLRPPTALHRPLRMSCRPRGSGPGLNSSLNCCRKLLLVFVSAFSLVCWLSKISREEKLGADKLCRAQITKS